MNFAKKRQVRSNAEDEVGYDLVAQEVDEGNSGQSGDEGYSSSRMSSDSQESAAHLGAVGRVHFTSRVQEKLAARAQKTTHAVLLPIGSEVDLEEATPRVRYTAPTDKHGATHDLPSLSTSASIGTADSVNPRSSLEKIPSSVREPRSSRILPRPPTSAIQMALTSDASIPTNDSKTNISRSRPSSDALRLTGESANSVKNRIAALEQKVKDVEEHSDTYV